MGPLVKRSSWSNYCFDVLLCSQLETEGVDRKCEIGSSAPFEGEYARIRSNIVVRYQVSIHGLICTPKNGSLLMGTWASVPFKAALTMARV